jgi:triacylglycerol lipase
VLLVVAAVAVLAVVRSSGGSAGVDQGRPGPVVVVPGYGGRVATVAPLVAELRRQGRTVAVLRPADDGEGDLRAQARQLRDLVSRTLRSSGAASVDLVGYSAGGVVVRLYVRDDGGADVVRRVLTIGSPHHGTDVAALAQEVAGGCPTACEQLATGSDLLRRLDAGDETPAGPAWATVRSTADQTVTPTDSASLTGALDVLVQDLCPRAGTSHGDLPGDPVTFAVLRSTLGVPAPRVPTQVRCG